MASAAAGFVELSFVDSDTVVSVAFSSVVFSFVVFSFESTDSGDVTSFSVGGFGVAVPAQPFNSSVAESTDESMNVTVCFFMIAIPFRMIGDWVIGASNYVEGKKGGRLQSVKFYFFEKTEKSAPDYPFGEWT